MSRSDGPPWLPESREEALDPAWLTAALASAHPDVDVRSVTVLDEICRVSSNIRFGVDLGAPVAGFPRSLCLKGYFTESGKPYRAAGAMEAFFYRDLATSIPSRTLRCLFAEVDPRTSNSVVITEDVVPLGATFLDGLSPYTPDQVAESLCQLADLHAYGWGRSDLPTLPGLTPRLDTYLVFRGLKEITFNFEGPIGAGVPREVADGRRLVQAYRSLGEQIHADTPWTIAHGDPHVGNIYIDGEHRPCLLDWQLTQRAPSYLDVGYHIVSALTVEDRRNNERDLFGVYRDRLLSRGIDPPGWAVSWSAFRRGVLHGFYLWGITLAVDPPITAELLKRLGTAAADHDVFESVP